VWLVALGELRDGASLVDVVAATLCLRNPAGTPMLELLMEFLSDRRLLVLWPQGDHDQAARLLRDGLQLVRLAGDPLTAAIDVLVGDPLVVRMVG
jgi:hypothetical protein